jgi:copper chaperone NosL
MTSAWRALAPLLVLAAGCGEPGPAPIAYGSDECRHCHMTIAEPQFAAELVTRKHKVYPFDDAGCLAAFVVAGEVPRDQIHSLWVNDFLAPDGMIRVEDAVFLRTDSVRTPMNTRVVALRPGPRADSLRAAWNGTLLPWPELLRRTNPRHEG